MRRNASRIINAGHVVAHCQALLSIPGSTTRQLCHCMFAHGSYPPTPQYHGMTSSCRVACNRLGCLGVLSRCTRPCWGLYCSSVGTGAAATVGPKECHTQPAVRQLCRDTIDQLCAFYNPPPPLLAKLLFVSEETANTKSSSLVFAYS